MAGKSATRNKIASEVNPPERPARVTKSGTPRVRTAKHTKPPIESSLQQEDSQAVIARIAYGFWEARGNQHGGALEDWLRAEQTYHQKAN